MPVKKFAISIPEDVMEQIDRAAADRGLTRSGFISDALRRIARARSDSEITRRVDALFADPAVAEEQRETAAAFRAAAPRRGTEW
jgi:metal-responsive CopG/Arc/MetJ family transcriptional regulator